jgi:CBS domain containing-hemolysin-like protein
VDEPPSLSFVINHSIDLGLTHPVILILVAVLPLVSAIISASESAFASITRHQLDNFRKSFKHQTILKLFDHPELLKITIKLISNFVRVGLISLLVMVLIDGGEPLVPSGFGIVFIILVMALIVDLIPRIYGRRYASGVIRLTGVAWLVLVKICRPFTKLLIDLRPLGNTGFEQTIGRDELNVVATTENNGPTPDIEKDILTGIARFGKLTVSQVMRHLTEISAIDASSDFAVLMRYVDKCGFSRIPVYRDALDNVEGILYIKDLLPFVNYPQDFQWQDLKRPGFFVRDSRKIDALLKDFQEKKVHMAIVVDNLGKTIGLVTLEDLLEEIIGVVKDGFEETDFFTKKKQNESFIADGIPLHGDTKPR